MNFHSVYGRFLCLVVGTVQRQNETESWLMGEAVMHVESNLFFPGPKAKTYLRPEQ